MPYQSQDDPGRLFDKDDGIAVNERPEGSWMKTVVRVVIILSIVSGAVLSALYFNDKDSASTIAKTIGTALRRSKGDSSDAGSSSSSSSSSISNGDLVNGVSIIVVDGNDLSVTTNRVGYDTLPYFSEDASEFLKYKILESHDGVVEPYGDMLFNVNAQNGLEYRFVVCSDLTGECLSGDDLSTTFSFGCTPLTETFTYKISEYSDPDETIMTRSATGTLLCMYVRREMRSLTESDLQKTIDAMYTMWSVSEEEGQALYGKNFHNYEYLLEFHYFNAAWRDADHIHEGNGFLAQHIKMDLIFEASLQVVDPSINLPYWDYTIEGAYNLTVYDSPMFTPDTFGTLRRPANETWGWLYKNDQLDDAFIADGRWANFEATYNTQFPVLSYGFGLMRSPWNLNPANKLTRFVSVDGYGKDLPSCSSHYSFLSLTKLVDFLMKAPYAPHGATHIAIGGVYGCDALDWAREAGYINGEAGQIALCKSWYFYMKEFFRMNILTAKTGCTSVNAQGEYSTAYDDIKCGFECNDDYFDELMNCLKGGGKFPAGDPINNIVNCVNGDLDPSIFNTNDDGCVPEGDDMPEEGWTAFKDFICTGDAYKIFGGDHLESASPADPSFWFIHPTLERLYQAKLMAGGFDTTEWPTDPSTEYVCGHHECFDSDYGGYGAWDTCCYGHYQDDQYMDFTVGLRSAHTGATNREIFSWTDPTSSDYGMNYIYDKFDWSHCQNQNVDIDGLLEELYSSVDDEAVSESSSKKSNTKGNDRT